MKTNKYEIDMCNGSIMDKLISFALPLMLSGILQLMFNAVDIIVVGHFTGKQALAAVGTSTPIMNIAILLISGMCMGASVLMSSQYGAKDYDTLSRQISTTQLLITKASQIKHTFILTLIYQKIGTITILLTGKYICHTFGCISLKALMFIFKFHK